MSPGGSPAWLRAGRVGRPHGLDGSFYVDEPKAQLLQVGRVLVVSGREITIAKRKGTDRRPIIQLDGLLEREGIESLRGQELLAARDEAPALGEDEWWEEDLEGCAVLAAGQHVGVVRRLIALPSCEALDVERDGARSLLVPLVSGAVRSINVERRQIEIDLGFLGEHG